MMRSLRRVRDRLQAALSRLGDWLFARRTVAVALKRAHVLCIGDSHSQVMRHVSVRGVWFRVKSLEGATASGLPNPKSKTRALEIFTAILERGKPWQHVLVQLGEVDCGFVIWLRAKRHGLSVEEQFQETLDAYTAFLAKIVEMGFRSTIVLSVPLPTISDDGAKWGKVARLRETVTASQLERTQLTVRFNSVLRERCAQVGATFVDVTAGHTDPDTGMVDARFVREEDDHHLADGPYAALIARELAALLPERRQPQSEGPSGRVGGERRPRETLGGG